jgi:hypothetical protein
VLCLLATTSISVIRFFARDPWGENAWHRLAAPAVAAVVGFGYGAWLRWSRPDVYQAIGLGAGP